jgi:hypothetical protein
MKRAALILLLALTAGFAGYHFTPTTRTTRALKLIIPLTKLVPATPVQQLDWLRLEFHLTDAQFAQVRALHVAYLPVCAEHCRRIMIAQDRLAELAHAGQKDTPAYAAAAKEWRDLTEQCDAATLAHVQAVAAAMDPAEGKRYLEMMDPRIARQTHLRPLSDL